jgi:hypothetical protein
MLDLHSKMSWAHAMHRKYFYFNYNLFVWYHNPMYTLTSSSSLNIWFLSSVFLFYEWLPRIFRPHWIISRTLYSGARFFQYPVFQEFFRSDLIISKDLVSRVSILTVPILFLCLDAFHLFWSIAHSPQNSNFHHFNYIWLIIQLI